MKSQSFWVIFTVSAIFTMCSSGSPRKDNENADVGNIVKTEDGLHIQDSLDNGILGKRCGKCNTDFGWDSDTIGISQLTWRQLMDRILPQVIAYSTNKEDSAVFFNNAIALRFPQTELLYLSNNDDSITTPHIFSYADICNIMFIAKGINKNDVFAIMYTGENNELYFYLLKQDQWKQIGHRKVGYGIPMGNIYLEEFNGKSGLEIIASTYPPNMNGNTWKELFIYDENQENIKFAGTFSTDYEVNLKDKTVNETYEGSHYMNPHKTLYVWHNDMLVPQKMAVVEVPDDWDTNNKRTLKYYENPSLKYTEDENSMTLIYQKEYDVSKEYDIEKDKFYRIWNNFFDK